VPPNAATNSLTVMIGFSCMRIIFHLM
jgi:hypothetical protein